MNKSSCLPRIRQRRPQHHLHLLSYFSLLFLLCGLNTTAQAQQRTISGKLALEGYGPPDSAHPTTADAEYNVPLTFAFCATDSPLFFTRIVTPAADGSFSVSDIPSGKYTLGIKGSKWLRRDVSVDASTGDVTILSASVGAPLYEPLHSGDATDDNLVDLTDFSPLINSYNLSSTDPDFDSRADFNNNGMVNSGDFGYLVNRFGEVGDTYVAELRATSLANVVTLHWIGSSGTNHYVVSRANPGSTMFTDLTPNPVTTTFTDTLAVGDTAAYTYHVKAISQSSVPSPDSNLATRGFLPVSLASVDRAQPGWAEDILPTDSPATAGAGPSSATSIDLTSGILENHPGPDLDAYNSVGLSPVFARLYRSAQAEQGYASPGLTAGWTHNYDLTVTIVNASTLHLTYPNGALETWGVTGSTITPQTPGTPYVVSGAGTPGQWTSLKMQFKDRTAYVFEPAGNGLYRLTQMQNAVGSTVFISYDGTGRLSLITNDLIDPTTMQYHPLLQFAYQGVLLSQVTDAVGMRTVGYGYDSNSNLSVVKQVNSPNSQWEYRYTLVNNTWPLLTQAGVVDPTNPTSNAIRLYPVSQSDPVGRITTFTDANGNYRIYNYSSGHTTVESHRADGTLDTVWTQNFDSDSGANTGDQDAYNYASQVKYEDPQNPKRPTTITNRNNQALAIAYDPQTTFGNVKIIKNPL